MARNIEIKARVDDLSALRLRLQARVGSPAEILHQEDVFFNLPKGRLKLRIFSNSKGQLIYYARSDQAGPKLSTFFISQTLEPLTLREVLTQACGVRGIIRKIREVYLHDQTRIHLDEVEDLGTFMEIEVVLDPDQQLEDGSAIAAQWMAQLGIQQGDLIEGAYIDLLEANAVTDLP